MRVLVFLCVVFGLGLSRPLAGGGFEGSRGVLGGLDGDLGTVLSWPRRRLVDLWRSRTSGALLMPEGLSRSRESCLVAHFWVSLFAEVRHCHNFQRELRNILS